MPAEAKNLDTKQDQSMETPKEPKKEEAPIRLKCIYGNIVKLQNLRTNEVSEYTLVTFNQEKLSQNIISNYTIIGKAIWAKHEGDEVEIDVPDVGKDRYKIVSIENA